MVQGGQNAGAAISIHALLAESDQNAALAWAENWRFLSTLSLRRATKCGPCMGRELAISIHALLAESDIQRYRYPKLDGHFYPRSPCGERRTKTRLFCCPQDFYPRSPCGERRGHRGVRGGRRKFLSTLSLRRATEPCMAMYNLRQISIHALLAESDSKSAQNSGALLRI